jgi:transcriptional regulator with GAF, ATPase, and Fis domain
MEPRLVSEGGVSSGSVYVLPEGKVSLGRDPSNQIVVDDASVSRHHCLFNRVAGQVSVTDLGSLNGTTVNGVSVSKRLLLGGDQVVAGDAHFLFLSEDKGDEDARFLSAVQLAHEDLPAQSKVRLRKERLAHLSPEKTLESLQESARSARDLRALLRISASINSVRGLNALQRQLLQLIFEVLPAERGAIVLTGTSPEEVISLIGWDKHARGEGKVRISQTVINQVLREGVSLLIEDVAADTELSKVESLRVARTSSLVCVPLVFFEEVIGAIYLETGDTASKFGAENLELLMGVASISAIALENALQFDWLESENQRLLEASQIKHQMIGNSLPMRKIYRLIGQIAPTDSTVLIRGESGTGKEMAAQAIHLNSLRADKPFVAINCAALPEQLFENEFFGHEREGFTGAASRHRGLLEVANGGTIFLDEVGELTPSVQGKLLRALEERKLRRVGGTESIEVDVRLVSATNKDLEESVKTNNFRKDLYYRLNVISFEMPSLRERGDDILLLASHFLRKYNQKYKRNITGITREARSRLLNHSWEGNVRELKNNIERAVVMGEGDLLTEEFLPGAPSEESAPEENPTLNMREAVREAQRRVIINSFKQSKCNYTETAKVIGMHPNHLHRLIRMLKLKSVLVQIASQAES